MGIRDFEISFAFPLVLAFELTGQRGRNLLAGTSWRRRDPDGGGGDRGGDFEDEVFGPGRGKSNDCLQKYQKVWLSQMLQQ